MGDTALGRIEQTLNCSSWSSRTFVSTNQKTSCLACIWTGKTPALQGMGRGSFPSQESKAFELSSVGTSDGRVISEIRPLRLDSLKQPAVYYITELNFCYTLEGPSLRANLFSIASPFQKPPYPEELIVIVPSNGNPKG